MKRLFALSVLLLSLLGSAGGVWAQQGYWRDLPPEDRRQLRQQMREHWQQEREIRREEGAPRWRDVPPEDRRRLRDDMREQRAWQERERGSWAEQREQRGWGEQRERRGEGRGWRRD
ncbi:MAG: hypothetical protein WA049_18145 [Ferribacterium limneticum]